MKTIIEENNRRNKALNTPYDPIRGIGCCGPRVSVDPSPYNDGQALVPAAMTADPAYAAVASRADWMRLRCRHDFEYWAASCVKIKAKTTGRLIPFVLNAPQRRVVALIEDDRLAGRPIRLIMLKARQWGGSTLIQFYMAWIQMCIDPTRNSLICAHVKDTAAVIRGMYSTMLANYPRELWDGKTAPQFRPFEQAKNIRVISNRGCRVTVGSSERSDTMRGADFALAHLSEVAYWRTMADSTPEMLISSVCGAINREPLTLIALESTANGPGNYFHREWLRAEDGLSDKRPVFVPWHEIEIYRAEVTDPEKLWNEMDQYERDLWDSGLTLEMIAWYHAKRREMASPAAMRAEYPGTPAEAFAAADRLVFAPEQVERLRHGCRQSFACGEVEGEGPSGWSAIRGVTFRRDTFPNALKIWSMPDPDELPAAGRYVVAVDVGGRSDASDWSVILVLDRFGGADGQTPEVVAQWRGHIDHDRLAWKSAAIARFYRDALLVFESNTFETDYIEGDPSLYILEEVRRVYPRLYHRVTEQGTGVRIGFHTNSATKTALISRMIAAVRDASYIERHSPALDELQTYEARDNGRFAAKSGCHDDMLMARAIALHVSASMPSSDQANIITRDPYFNRFRW